MLYKHSFWPSAARKSFDAALQADPACAIAYWGIAQSLRGVHFAPTPPKNLAEGLAAIERAKAIGAKTQRERDLISALTVFFADHDKQPHPARVGGYAKAMEEVAQQHKDDEVQIQHALALLVATSPVDRTHVNQLKAASILEPIFKRQPRHPGVAHYLIHAYDFPALAEKGLEAARRYAQVASSAPHALHMPSHIYTRLGAWRDSIASNLASAQVAKEVKSLPDQLHAMDYLVYAHLQLGQDGRARAVVEEMGGITGFPPAALGAVFARAASPARYMLERGDWNGAASLEVRPTQFPFVDAMTRFARALGAARAGKPQLATDDVAKLVEMRDKLRAAKNDYWAEQVDIQWQIASAWTIHAEGKHGHALKLLAAAADAEDKTTKHPVTPGPLVPARELYGFMLYERGKAKEALAAFESTLKIEPNRFGATLGAARSARSAGDSAKARLYYSRIAALAGEADGRRAELEEARTYVSDSR